MTAIAFDVFVRRCVWGFASNPLRDRRVERRMRRSSRSPRPRSQRGAANTCTNRSVGFRRARRERDAGSEVRRHQRRAAPGLKSSPRTTVCVVLLAATFSPAARRTQNPRAVIRPAGHAAVGAGAGRACDALADVCACTAARPRASWTRCGYSRANQSRPHSRACARRVHELQHAACMARDRGHVAQRHSPRAASTHPGPSPLISAELVRDWIADTGAGNSAQVSS